MNIGKELEKGGVSDNVLKSRLIELGKFIGKHMTGEELVAKLIDIVQHPHNYTSETNKRYKTVLNILLKDEKKETRYNLLEHSLPYKIYGNNLIEELAVRQMDVAMKLPVTVAGALMPDAHAGYGLPIGGVLATRGVVLPYAVGRDIGCRMQLTILDASSDWLDNQKNKERTISSVWNNTAFGMDGVLPYTVYDPVLDKIANTKIGFLKNLHGKAKRQLGTSGGGNHFVDVCKVTVNFDNPTGLKDGEYVGILSHSGSRGLGSEIAEYYTKLAKETCKLPKVAGAFAWLDINSEKGQEYWWCMNTAMEYSEASHKVIHENVARGMRLKPVATIGNFHNLATREAVGGEKLIVHRKGATPAHLNEIGIIPGSMADCGVLVLGKGCDGSLYSASHGTGRRLSRQDAKNTYSKHALKKELEENGVTLLEGTTEEAPGAYKNMFDVLQHSKTLFDVWGTVSPVIVRMNKE